MAKHRGKFDVTHLSRENDFTYHERIFGLSDNAVKYVVTSASESVVAALYRYSRRPNIGNATTQ